MRKFKFRIWNSHREKWEDDVEGTKICLNGDLHLTYLSGLRRGDYIIEQFTGLKDIDGKDIYENDIIQVTDSPYKYTILWDDFGWSIYDYDDALGYDDPYQPFNSVVQQQSKVVGNVHEL